MKRWMLDTGVYSLLLSEREKELVEKLVNMEERGEARVYGFEIIKKELKSAPRTTTHYSKNLMADLLRLYGSLAVKEYVFEQRMMDLAVEYYRHYRTLGGGISSDNLMHDFLIVACASLKEIDLVVSADKRTMLNEYSRRSYELANSGNGMRTPRLVTYEAFKKEVKR